MEAFALADTLPDMPKRIISLRLSADALAILDALGRRHGLTRTAVIEMVVRSYASDHPEQLRPPKLPEREAE